MNIGKQFKKIGNYQLLQSIGKGANATVYKGLNNQNGRSVAIKQVRIAESEIKNIQFEIDILRQLEHENIVKYIDSIQVNDQLYIVLQYIEGGSLASFIKKNPNLLDEKLVKVYIKQVIKGLDYLHQMGVVHRDIKGANILLTKEGIIKLADFGGAMRLTGDNKTFSMMGTPYWMAPEMIENKGEITTSCDIWSLGCTIIELLTGKPPYFQLLPYPALLRIVQEPHPPLPDVSSQCREFLLKCLQKQPSRRPKAFQLLRDPWFNDGEQPSHKSNQLDIKTLLKQRNYEAVTNNLKSILSKKIIYTNPIFIQIVYDPESEEKAKFLLDLMKQDYECIQYFCSVGVFNRLFSCISPTQINLNRLCAQVLLEIVDASIKEGTLSIFMSTGIEPLKKLFYLQYQQKCMKVLYRLFSEEIIPISHLGYIVCKEGILFRIFVYMQSNIKSNPNEASKCISIVQKIASSKEPSTQIQFKQVVETLVNLLATVDRTDIIQKILKTIYNISKHQVILQELYVNEIVPTILNFITVLKKKKVKQQLFQLYYYAMKTLTILSQDGEGLEKLRQSGWEEVIDGIQIRQIIKKDIQDIYETLVNKTK